MIFLRRLKRLPGITMAANMYRVGDYVYFETSSTTPYQIRRIEELNKTPNGNVEAKVMCFYRRRDISSSLTLLADKHQSNKLCNDFKFISLFIDGVLVLDKKKFDENSTSGDEKDPADCKITEFLEENSEIETKTPEDVSDKQKHQLKHRELFLSRQVETLPATHIRGKCVVTLLNETESLLSYLNKEDTFFYSLVYDPSQKTLLADKGEIRVGSRFQADITEKLNEGEEDGRTMEDLEELIWTPDNGHTDREVDQFLIISRSVGTFARALDCTSTVRQPSLHMSAAAASRDITLLPWKSLKSIIEYYYMWKTTDRYVQQKRIKAAEAESKLKQVYIPNYNKPNPAAISGKMNGVDGQVSGRACESCYDGERPGPTQRQERIAQFNAIRMHRCTITGCGKEFRLKAHLARHLATAHGLVVRSGSPRPVMKTRAAFCLITTPLTRISRRLCQDILNPHRAARSPFTPINIAAIKQECQLRLAEVGKYVPEIKSRAPQTLEPVVSRLGINIKVEKPALLHKSENDHKKPEHLFFPRSASQPQQFFNENVSKLSSGSSPSIMKKRGYEQSNGVDGPSSKRPNMGVIRQIGSNMRSYNMRGNVLNHNMNGRGRLPISKSMRMHMINWIDAPDDVYFVATDATRKIRKQMSTQDFKRAARNPWRCVPIKVPVIGNQSDIVVLD
ncbi:hypothetical protein KUTeg_012957 [Tegillarca granosa]|uniref:Uncharacterized protein n=1 Tax=Tegillarca granosa TaxID=220873 RepID=A0ABQ9EXS9_TEGGR|nr:hypothetical protein KUTeg_012957 [Tegillarca granosa]